MLCKFISFIFLFKKLILLNHLAHLTGIQNTSCMECKTLYRPETLPGLQRIVLVFLLLCFTSSTTGWSIGPRSSQSNGDLVGREYKNDPIQRWVARGLGDEIPRMRDDLIRRKNNGEGTIKRHLNAWTTLDNWKVDWGNDLIEDMSPYSG